MRYLAALVVFLAVALGVACGGGDDSSGVSGSVTATPGGIATLTGLQAQLAAVLLQPEDVPPGLEGNTPTFSTNAEVAGADPDALAKMVAQGRQLGVDVQYIPTQSIDPASPVRGGIQTSASVYTNVPGAAESFAETAAAARANDWAANYPDLLDLRVTDVQQTFGDESVWLRISGKDSQEQKLQVIDNIVIRSGRTRAYLQVVTQFPGGTPDDTYQAQISQWAQAVVQHAQAQFPTAQSS